MKSLTYEEVIELVESVGEKSFRGTQLYQWIHQKLAKSYEDMTNLSKGFRKRLQEITTYTTIRAIRIQESKVDHTKKFLFALEDGNVVESVWMKYKHGNSVCISSQIGCRMGCKFCASTLEGLERSLTTSEMLEQIYEITRITGERVSNVVVMGMGEPFDNYEALIRFITLLTNERGLHISQRNLTISTCGIVPKIRQLAEEELQVTLALSLHATTDEKRKAFMPIADAYSLEETMEACDYYFHKTKRRITFEYSLVRNVNDREEDARELIGLVKGRNCHVNLIPVNPVKECGFEQSYEKEITNFKNKLEKNGINVTIRREMGRDIDGACGQLRRREMKG
ncbi:MAG: 23S rRNA (adenine(2503)-C(2))-methyltransferase RlmN [Eubacteriales bacterium]